MRVAILACLLVALMPRQAPKSSRLTRDPFCSQSLEEFCARNKCVTDAAQVKTMRTRGNCSVTSFGKCGTLRTTYRSGDFDSETRYFDKAGKLIAVRAGTEVYLTTAGPDWAHYGAVIKCRVTNLKLRKPV